nr:hypothetical protein [uncultured Sphaerochaeta sp.]
MKPEEAMNLLGALPCTEEDKRRARIGNIKLLGIVIKGMKKKDFISDKEKSTINFYLYENLEHIKNNDFDISEFASYILAVMYYILHLVPFVLIYLVAILLEKQIGSFGKGLWYFISIASYLYLLFTKFNDDNFILQIKKLFQRFYIHKLKKLEENATKLEGNDS